MIDHDDARLILAALQRAEARLTARLDRIEAAIAPRLSLADSATLARYKPPSNCPRPPYALNSYSRAD